MYIYVKYVYIYCIIALLMCIYIYIYITSQNFIIHAGVEMRNSWPEMEWGSDIPYKTCSTLKGTLTWAKKDSSSVNIYVN